eukprot:2848569-Amphidinium_carterae.1
MEMSVLPGPFGRPGKRSPCFEWPPRSRSLEDRGRVLTSPGQQEPGGRVLSSPEGERRGADENSKPPRERVLTSLGGEVAESREREHPPRGCVLAPLGGAVAESGEGDLEVSPEREEHEGEQEVGVK